MIKDVFESIGAAARKMFTNWGALLISLLLYAALILALHSFIETLRESTKLQVALNALVILAALALFFMIQVMGVSYVRIGVGAGYLLKRALKDCWKLLLVSLPLILLAWLIVYLFGLAEARWLKPTDGPRRSLEVALMVAQILLLYVALPLIAMHLWIAVVREGVVGAFKGIGRSIIRALAPRSLLIYVLVIAVFGAISYFLLLKQVSVEGIWLPLWLVGAKTALILLMVFFGWWLTLGALAEMTARRAMEES
jgi:hypothetical protein